MFNGQDNTAGATCTKTFFLANSWSYNTGAYSADDHHHRVYSLGHIEQCQRHDEIFRGPPARCTAGRPHMATLLIVTAVLVCGTLPARAQVSMSVMPIRAELAVQPGQMETQLFQVENPSEEPLRLSIAVADWFIDASGVPLFVKRGSLPGFSMSAWIEVNPTQFELPPRSIQTVRYTVTVPPGIPTGSYRTAMLVESLPDFDRASPVRVAQLSARIGVIVYNRIGDVEPETRRRLKAHTRAKDRLLADQQRISLPDCRAALPAIDHA